ncbi:hypothetical protein BV898_07187 [Hypsibius exemplaris]|uniref:Uncharacterized protein n=1 Tax=Hypsibius exemplaris TaxID=2072580 RepID=A0A1W0WU60_HYPEX|nr:hypothetical protein BV898_07187 [Hypsibius exemplaris]
MANSDTYQLLEFQPKTCYLPPRDEPATLRRSISAGGVLENSAGSQVSSFPQQTLTGAERMHQPGGRRGGYSNVGYEMDSYKQPLLQPPLFVLMPAASAGDYYAGRSGMGALGGDTAMMAYGSGGMDTLARRRRQSYRDLEYADPYRRKRSCCSCWRFAIAMIIILAILGVGASIAGVVFIKLIDDDVIGPNVSHSSTIHPITSTAASESFSFDISPEGGFANVSSVVISNGSLTLIKDSPADVDGKVALSIPLTALAAPGYPLTAREDADTIVATSNVSSPDSLVTATDVVLEDSPAQPSNETASQFDLAVAVLANNKTGPTVGIAIPDGVSATINVSSSMITALPSLTSAVVVATPVPMGIAETESTPITTMTTPALPEGTTALLSFVLPPKGMTAAPGAVNVSTTLKPAAGNGTSPKKVSLTLSATTPSPMAADIVQEPVATGPGIAFSATMRTMDAPPVMSHMNSFQNALDAAQLLNAIREDHRKPADLPRKHTDSTTTPAAPTSAVVIINIVPNGEVQGAPVAEIPVSSTAPTSTESPVTTPAGSSPSSLIPGKWK